MFIALGSANELEYQLQLSRELGFLAPGDHEALSVATREVKQMLSALIAKMRA